jgi:hypothetical protein
MWENIEDVELVIIPSYPWWMNILPLSSVDEDRRIARTAIPATSPMCKMVFHAREEEAFRVTAWIENVPEGMLSPGTWMVNTQTRKVYLWPEGERPSEDIYVPLLRELIRVEGRNDESGDADEPVKGLCFTGLQFTKADRGIWKADDAGIQHDWEMMDKDNAMLRFRGAEGCRVEACSFFNAGGNAIRMDLYARDIHVTRCLFHNLGQSAVMMLGYGPGTKDVNSNHEIVNNHIHHCGEVYWHSQMITCFQSGNNRIAHNYIHHVPRKGICICGVRLHMIAEGKSGRRECVSTIRWSEIGTIESYTDLLPYQHSHQSRIHAGPGAV